MERKTRTPQRREDSLSRDRIIEASIALLDQSGEDGLTFRALSEQLATGAGAIYWHVANKNDLLVAACDAIIARTVAACAVDASPQDTLRALALGMFDAMDAHPWVGSALILSAGQMPTVRLLESLGQQVRLMSVPPQAQWATVCALLSFIVGEGGQNAANGQLARAQETDRSQFLQAVSTAWSALPEDYPFTRSMAASLPMHDDRADFLAGVDLILAGIAGLQTAP